MFEIISSDDHHIGSAVLFYNKLSDKGYFWSEATLNNGQFVSGQITEVPGGNHKLILPLQNTSVEKKRKHYWEPPHKRFIRLSGTPASFIDFANEYGPIVPIHKLPQELRTIDRTHSNSLDFWIDSHKTLSIAHDIFSSKYDDATLLKKFDITSHQNDKRLPIEERILDFPCTNLKEFSLELQLLATEQRFFNITHRDLPLYTFQIYPESLHSCKLPSIQEISKIWLYLLFAYIAKSTKYAPIKYSVRYSASENKWFPLIQPITLLGAMWFAFGEELCGNRKYKKCLYEKCGRWQDVTDNYDNWQYHPACADAKRAKDYRDRKKMNANTAKKKV